MPEQLLNYVGSAWGKPANVARQDVHNPATAEILARVPLSPPAEVERAAQAAAAAFARGRLRAGRGGADGAGHLAAEQGDFGSLAVCRCFRQTRADCRATLSARYRKNRIALLPRGAEPLPARQPVLYARPSANANRLSSTHSNDAQGYLAARPGLGTAMTACARRQGPAWTCPTSSGSSGSLSRQRKAAAR